MLALEILVNGKLIMVAGVADWDLIQAHILARKTPDGTNDMDLNVRGLPVQTDPETVEHIRWPSTQLQLGDKVEIKVIESENVTPPLIAVPFRS